LETRANGYNFMMSGRADGAEVTSGSMFARDSDKHRHAGRAIATTVGENFFSIKKYVPQTKLHDYFASTMTLIGAILGGLGLRKKMERHRTMGEFKSLSMF